MLDTTRLDEIIKRCLTEDIGTGDITTLSVVPSGHRSTGHIWAKEAGIVAGLPVAEAVYRHLDPAVDFQPQAADGDVIVLGTPLAMVEGPARSILTGERLALNFLQRLSGIATLASRLVEAVKPYRVRVVDTRKTTPGLRLLEKYAVRMGGGHNHRFGLYDAVLLKDNHVQVAGGVARAVTWARQLAPHTMKVEVEVEDLAGVKEALAAGADIIMLDNMDLDTMRQAVALIGNKAVIEASGSISLDRIQAVAATGVHVISVGALTHSAPALDISLDLGKPKYRPKNKVNRAD
ncbi:MAG: carboxylating nicotinate-nucleotide diphosphorylase [Bacillota bacterium]